MSPSTKLPPLDLDLGIEVLDEPVLTPTRRSSVRAGRLSNPTRSLAPRGRADVFGGLLVALAASIPIVASVWLTTSDAQLLWLTGCTGILMAAAVRLGAGPVEPELRAVLAATATLVLVLVIQVLRHYTGLSQLLDDPPAVREAEVLLRLRMKADPTVPVMMGAAVFGSVVLSYLLRRR